MMTMLMRGMGTVGVANVKSATLKSRLHSHRDKEAELHHLSQREFVDKSRPSDVGRCGSTASRALKGASTCEHRLPPLERVGQRRCPEAPLPVLRKAPAMGHTGWYVRPRSERVP
jgi:hypothetical protein